MTSQLVREINSVPSQLFISGNELNPGTYLIEVTQGDSRKVVKGIKK